MAPVYFRVEIFLYFRVRLSSEKSRPGLSYSFASEAVRGYSSCSLPAKKAQGLGTATSGTAERMSSRYSARKVVHFNPPGLPDRWKCTATSGTAERMSSRYSARKV